MTTQVTHTLLPQDRKVGVTPTELYEFMLTLPSEDHSTHVVRAIVSWGGKITRMEVRTG